MKPKPIYIKQCKHDLAERETACADGMCPICLLDTVVVQRASMMSEEQELDRLGDAIMGGPVELGAERRRMLARLIGFLINNERGNVRADIHALMHCMPRWAAANGYPSMRSSAIACGVSREYIRRRRNQWCQHLDLPIPTTKPT